MEETQSFPGEIDCPYAIHDLFEPDILFDEACAYKNWLMSPTEASAFAYQPYFEVVGVVNSG